MYNKTHFFLSDFFYTTSDDAFPIFKEMLKLKLNVHYIDSKKEIYEQFCKNDKKCTKIIPIFNGFIDGDFLERYLDIILKLKIIIAGHELKSFYNIFFYMKEITYINLGHGIKYFKHFLYNNYTSCKKFNKLVLPPSKKIISIAKRYGWSQENIIQNCLPKWDRYNNYQSNMISDFNKNEKNKSIFIMFTWRNFLNESYNISPYYLNNVINLINNEDLYKSLVTKNLIVLDIFVYLTNNKNIVKILVIFNYYF